MEEKTNYFSYFIFGVLVYFGCNFLFNMLTPTPNPSMIKQLASLYHFDNLKDPEQTAYSSWINEDITREKGNYQFKIYPRANYRIYAMVMSKARYHWGWGGDIIPYDLALAWNDLMLPENQKDISYSQSGRWYYYRYNDKFSLPQSYIISHSSNHHIIPADDNVFKAIDRVKTKQKIYLEGYLVDIKGTVNGRDDGRNTSLTREDSGAGSCEIFYVKKAVLGDQVYQ